MVEKRQFPHHLIREVFEQPEGLRRTIEPRVSLDQGQVRLEEVQIPVEELRAIQSINIVASGTSRHAGIAGQFMAQELAGVHVDVDYASEFENRNPTIGPCELSIFITQSGETADTTGALREAKQRGSRTIAISNVVGSTIAREADGVIYTHAGPEISIASTKAFTAQIACLFMFALYLGQIKEKVSQAVAKRYIGELLALPEKIETILASADQCEQLAEGYPTGEAKHGPNALIDYRLPLVMIATCDRDDVGSVLRYEKNVSNMEGFKKQGGTVIAIATEGDTKIPQFANHTFFVPKAPELLSPILEIVPLQLFAYYVAAKRGLNVDRPRNLVKSVTLE